MKRYQKLIRYGVALLTLFVLFSSFYFQYVKGLQPCPLCLMQRLCVFLLFGLCFMGLRLDHSPSKRRVIDCIVIFIAAAGLFFAIRQLWLLSLPPEAVPSCMPGLDVLFHYFPWKTIAVALFWGTGECGAEVPWHLFGLSMPEWSAAYFFFMMIYGVKSTILKSLP